MRIFLFTSLLTLASIYGKSQSLIGNWQLVKQTNCQGEEFDIIKDSKSTGKTGGILSFKDAQNGEESSRILNQSKSSTTKNFLYKLNENTLYILDKRSHMIVNTLTVDSIQPDSLILSNVSQPCDIKVFSRIK